MAGLGRKTFTAGEVLTAADVNGYLMDQSVMVFGGTAARGSAIPSPSEGMVTYRSDDNQLEVYNGSAWAGVGNAYAMAAASGTVTGLSIAPSDGIGVLATINWPAGRFTVAPVVYTSVRGTAVGSYKAIVTAEGGGTASSPLFVASANSAATITTLVFDVLAVQMTAGAAVG
jgi:hypothetical protein